MPDNGVGEQFGGGGGCGAPCESVTGMVLEERGGHL
jgi:hypothetical protein